MLTSFPTRAASASALFFTVLAIPSHAQGKLIEPLSPSELQVTVGGVPVSGGIRMWIAENFGHGPAITDAEMADVVRRCKEIAAASPQSAVFPPSPLAFDLQFTVNSPPAGAAAAVSAIESYYESLALSSHSSGPIQITINFGPLGGSTLMSTGQTLYSFSNTLVQNNIAANMDGDDILQGFMPTTSTPVQFTFGGGVTNCPDVYLSAGAIVGMIPSVVSGLATPHATITVNSSFTWDYDPTNGITAGQICFRSTFAHEVAHVLGFNSVVGTTATNPTLQDMLRFQRSTNNATGFTDFKTHNRLVHSNTPNDDHELSLVYAHYAMEDGNPNQAEHFREQVSNIGLMDPSMGAGESFYPIYLQPSDLRVLDAIGFDWNDPALTTTALTRFDVEPNGSKSNASPATAMTVGSTIVGTTTGNGFSTGDTTLTSRDVFRVQTAALPLGVYRHALSLTSATPGVTSSIRGLDQTNGVIGTGETPIQLASNISGTATNVWYGFGKQEEVYYAVEGGPTTTAVYAATLSTSTISVPSIAGTFVAGTIMVKTAVGQTTDTEIYLYDGNLNPVPLGHNDDTGGGGSLVTVNLAPGTYYVAISTYNTANNQSDLNPNEGFKDGQLLDFPNALLNNDSTTTGAISYTVSDGITTTPVAATHGSAFHIQWGRFTVVNGAPRNDNCANAVNVGVGTTAGSMLGATHDGSATCDPGGAASKDVWFSHTNTSGGPRLLAVTTCGVTGVNDTVLSVYSSCGGTELACSDNCGGSPCGGPTSCVSGLVINNNQTVLIRVSDKGLGWTTGNFSLNVSEAIQPPSNDSCTTPISLVGFSIFPIDNSGATTGVQGQTESLCNFFGGHGVRQDTWFTWRPTSSGTVTVSTCGLIGSGPSEDSKIAIYNGAGCPTGPAIACNDDAVPACASGGAGAPFNASVSFNAVCGATYTFQMGMYYDEALTMEGSFRVTGGGVTTCPTPTTSVCKGDGTDAPCPCANTSNVLGAGCASPFYSGAGATLSSTGVASVVNDTLVLTANNIPGPCLFIQTNLGSSSNFGDGLLCSMSNIVRLGVVFSSGGVASYPGGTTPNPIHIAGMTTVSSVRIYQCWYRSNPSMCSPAALYNLTQGLQLTWMF